jgi:hypothetical protein
MTYVPPEMSVLPRRSKRLSGLLASGTPKRLTLGRNRE